MLDTDAVIADLTTYREWLVRVCAERPSEAERVWAVKLMKRVSLALMTERVRLGAFAPTYSGLPEDQHASV